MFSTAKEKIFGIAGPLLALLCYLFFRQRGMDPAQSKAAAVLIWMAVWWVSEAVNIYMTSLLPLILLPLTGTMPMKVVAPNYMHEIIFLFIGGFLFAFALEKWNLHNRIALKIILSVGKTPARVLFGVMFAAYFLSMWINNTATTAMLIPATLAIVGQLEKQHHGTSKLAAPLLIGLAFSASIGGMATLIGTAPNMIFLKEYTEAFPHGHHVSFADWLIIGVPLSMIIFLGTYFVLRFLHRDAMTTRELDMSVCRQEYSSLGKLSREEKWMFFFFFVLFLGWFFLKEIRIGSLIIPSWTSLLGLPPGMFTESSVAMTVVVFILFFIPSSQKGEFLLSWNEVKRLPVGIIFLFGGGFAISNAVEFTGLDQVMAGGLSGLKDVSPLLLVILLCVFMTLLSEFASNTASLQLVFPVLATFVSELPVDPLMVLIPVTLAASCGFMLPIATPPNTIVFGSEKITASEMIRAGFFVDLVGIITISFGAYFLLSVMF